MQTIPKILLINPGRYLYAYPSLALAYLAAYLQRYSHFTPLIRIADENAKEDVEEAIKKFKPQIIGISATTPQVIRAHKIARFCKSFNPHSICIVGGVHISILPRRTLKEFPAFDLGIYGEGEKTFQELADHLIFHHYHLDHIDFAQIQGVVYRQEEKILLSPRRELITNLDEIPLPARRLYNLKYYRKPRQAIRGVTRRAIQMMSSRGCPYNCRFCSSHILWQRRVRFHSPERFIQEVEDLIHLGFNGFYLHDDTFIANKERVRKICTMLLKKQYHRKMIWAAQLRPNLIQNQKDVELLKLMKAAGCIQVEYGFESGSERVLSFLKKESATVVQNQKAIDLTKKAGLRIFGNFMLGTPGETKKELLETKAFVLRNKNKLDYYQTYVTTPYPGTEVWNICRKENLLKDATWEKFGMGILDDFVFSHTIDKNFIHQNIQELNHIALKKIPLGEKLKWLGVRLTDDPHYVSKMLKNYFHIKS